jgi:hypothetical protein
MKPLLIDWMPLSASHGRKKRGIAWMVATLTA